MDDLSSPIDKHENNALRARFQREERESAYRYNRNFCSLMFVISSVALTVDLALFETKLLRIVGFVLVCGLSSISRLSPCYFPWTRVISYFGWTLLFIVAIISTSLHNRTFPYLLFYFLLFVFWIFIFRDFKTALLVVPLTTVCLTLSIYFSDSILDDYSESQVGAILIQNVLILTLSSLAVIRSFEKDRMKMFRAIESAKASLQNVEELMNRIPVGIAVWNFSKILRTNRQFENYFRTLSIPCTTKLECFARLNEFTTQEDGFTLSQHLQAEDEISLGRKFCDDPGVQHILGKFKLTQGILEDHIFEVALAQCCWLGEASFLLIFQDITAMETAFREISDLNSLKTRWLRTVSHELKTPLNGVLGVFQFLRKENLGEKNNQLLDTGSHAAKSLLLYVSDILDYFQLQSGALSLRLKSFDVGEAIKRTIELVQLRYQDKKVEIHCQYNKIVNIKCFNDENRLEQILLNLLSNAFKFTPEGGFVEVVASEKPEDIIHISVADTGIGIKEVEMETIFHEFTKIYNEETEKLNPHGNGLGLWISRCVAQAMGGDLIVDSTFREGSTFTLTLKKQLDLDKKESDKGNFETQSVNSAPTVLATSFTIDVSETSSKVPEVEIEIEGSGCRPVLRSSRFHPMKLGDRRKDTDIHEGKPQTKRINKAKSAEVYRGPNSRKVLIVDDEALNCVILGLFLGRKKIAFETACNGQEALEMIKPRSPDDCYSLIIMDYQMPKMNGPECCKILKSLQEEGVIPPQTIVGHTAYCAEEDLDYFRSCGVVDIMPKPLSEGKLVEILERWLPVIER